MISRQVFKKLLNLKTLKLASPICTAAKTLDLSLLNKNSTKTSLINHHIRPLSSEAQPKEISKPQAPPSSFICAEDDPVSSQS